MKITKSQLKRIIKEELETLLDEGIIDRMRKGFDQSVGSGKFGLGSTQKGLRGASRIGRGLTGRLSKTQKALKVAKDIFASHDRGHLARLYRLDMENETHLTDFVQKFFEEHEITGVSASKVVEQIIRLLTPKRGPPPPITTPKPPETGEAEEGTT